MTKKARIHEIMTLPCTGEFIEKKSFATIDREAPSHNFSAQEWQIVRRMIHTTGDFSIMDSVKFSADAIQAGIAALKAGRPIYADSNMISSGLSMKRLGSVSDLFDRHSVHCYIADEKVAEEARRLGS